MRNTGTKREIEFGEVSSTEYKYTCPDHIATGGYEPCCDCGGWEEGEEKRKCSEAKY